MSVARARLVEGVCLAMACLLVPSALVPSAAYAGTSTTTSTATSSTSPTTSPTSSTTTTSSTNSPSSSPTSAPVGTPVARAAAFSVAALTDGDHVGGPYGPDLAQSVDVAFALTAAGGQSAALGQVLAYLQAHAGAYVHGDPTKGEKLGAQYAGPTAKLALLAQLSGNDPSAFGGLDLIAELRGLMATSGPKSGRFVDTSAFGDFANPLGQAFAVLALQRGTTAGAPQAALGGLTNAQCADGGFPATFDTTPCVSSVDATSLAVQALVASGADCPAARALAWLQARQSPTGAFDAGPADTAGASGPSVSATAYATQALTATGRSTTSALAYLGSVQNPDGGLPASASSASSELPTAQALLAFAGTSFLTLGPHPLATHAPVCVAATSAPTAVGPAAGASHGSNDRSAAALAVGERSPSPSTTTASAAGAGDTSSPSAAPSSSTTTAPSGDVIVFGTASSAPPAQAVPSVPLAYTGADLLTPVASGFVLLLTGLTLLFASRRRRGRHA